MLVTVYVRLLDEDIDVWRPLEATPLGDDVYLLSGPAPEPEDETWEFPYGSKVRCRPTTFQDSLDDCLVAFELAAPS